MKIVVLDGYTLNPGDNPWDPLAALGDLTVYDAPILKMCWSGAGARRS